MPYQNKRQGITQKRGGFGGRGRGRGRGRGGYKNFRRNKKEEKAVFDNRIKYPKNAEDFKTYVAPGSKKWFEQSKIANNFWNSSEKKKTEQRYLTEIKIEECNNYSDYLPRTFPKMNKNIDYKIVDPIDDPKGQHYHYETGFCGATCSIEPNTWSDFWKTRRGKRTAYNLQYLNERKKNKARYERMKTTRQNDIRDIPGSYRNTIQSYNKVAER